MSLLVLWAVLASTGAPSPASTPAPGSVSSSEIRLDAGDPAGALADAEAAIAEGGGADAYAARADAKRALGRPIEEVIADYARASQLDPRYLAKYNGLIVQRKSELQPEKKTEEGLLGVPLGFIMAVGLGGALLVAGGVLYSRLRRRRDMPENVESPKAGETGAAPPEPPEKKP